MKFKDRVILHCDANNFFASVETVSRPDLANKPVAVSGNPQKRTGIILAKNELAKKHGVKTGEAIWMARQKCPDLVCLPPHHDLYEQYSQKLKQIYLSYTEKVEPFGIDECWLDVTSSTRLFGSGPEIAEKIRQQVKKELKITVSVGVSFCKIFAKLASDLKKPDAVTIIDKNNFKKIIYPLPINAIMGIGRKMEQALQKMNVLTLGDYVALPDNLLDKKWGIVGVELKQKLLGNDTSEVASQISTPKSVGNGTTTIVDITTEEEFIATIGFLSEKIATRLREKSLLAGGVGVYVKTADFEHFSKERKLDYPTNSSSVIAQNAMKILKSFWNFDTPVRAVRVHTFALVDEQALTQASLFFDTKKQRLGYGLDQIWNKYGPDAIALASSVKSNFLNK
jgi:DNA polymerase-4